MQKDSKIALLFCGAIVGLLITASIVRNTPPAATEENGVVVTENGIQIINLTAKGGYSPKLITATAGVPTELHVATNGTFDCSSSLVIPALKYQEILQPTGVATIPISATQAQGTLEGTCGMGMYDFQIAFK